LASLDLRNNWIVDTSSLELLTKCCVNLNELSLLFNPLSTERTYRISIFEYLPKLYKLDGTKLKEKDKEVGKNKCTEITETLIQEHLKQKNTRNADGKN
jgi:hypothetical protein